MDHFNPSAPMETKSSRRWLYIIATLFVIGMAVLASTVHRYKVVVTIPTTAEAYSLTEAERANLEQAVYERHDAASAYQLAEFFIYARNDSEAGMRWMKKAAELGHSGAQAYLEQANVTKRLSSPNPTPKGLE